MAPRSPDPLTLARFRREAKAASALNHPNIGTIYDIDADSRSPDSSQLAFMDETCGESKGYVVGADGRGLRQVNGVERTLVWIIWSADAKSLYVSTIKSGSKPCVWQVNADGSNPEKLLDDSCAVTDSAPHGKYLLGMVPYGDAAGIYQVSIAEKKFVPLLPGVETFGVRFARDGKSFLYAVASRGEVTFYRQTWSDGRVIGKPQIALKLPFAFGLYYKRNAFGFSRDLSSVVYARPAGQADLYLLSQAQ